MNQTLVIELGTRALITVIKVAAPMLGLGMAVGLLVSIFQATTQIQEQTLAFIPKILAVLSAIIFFGPWMLNVLVDFVTELFTNIPNYIG
ncbi:flagellar biosynthetic protein FliQ [Orenia metallireducens]|jgi:flagellar biosynthetic protein FliQ|uniref:Flagellar biosynthetic protein FliQ n=1 Tax=Orenia metallireducens TaxID=1413210 RepID=A0A285FPF8_9FIRM|nr:flagellar biosynthesis protein FliQ [Orenia metallireducens]PRX33660.1 flagellar biosynthetic protein FliQ [Orenia metallireducens]SNY12973.1 flagellar biosynthetic protein FliQ [Orenia metallireducens]